MQEFSPYQADLDWPALTEADEMAEVLEQLGRATAKVHCVSDADDESTPLVDFQTENAVLAVVSGREDDLVADVVAFGLQYGARARADHALFGDAFRNGRIASALLRAVRERGLCATRPPSAVRRQRKGGNTVLQLLARRVGGKGTSVPERVRVTATRGARPQVWSGRLADDSRRSAARRSAAACSALAWACRSGRDRALGRALR